MYRGWAYCRSQNKTVVGKVILFGSYAKSNPHLDSDIDLLVVLDSNKKSK
ncbi:MAG: nucleotidyltransferase domain-containing protein, partial [Deltaproteobacteria bacterium]|nr:nucleotidyltransferase domain-containing protein [Deltaproteobacteria bacterium]